MKTGLVRMIHRGCGKPAFLAARSAAAMAYVGSNNTAHLDGSPMQSLERVFCGSCGVQIDMRWPSEEVSPEVP